MPLSAALRQRDHAHPGLRAGSDGRGLEAAKVILEVPGNLRHCGDGVLCAVLYRRDDSGHYLCGDASCLTEFDGSDELHLFVNQDFTLHKRSYWNDTERDLYSA